MFYYARIHQTTITVVFRLPPSHKKRPLELSRGRKTSLKNT